jgi:hypothetical protein
MKSHVILTRRSPPTSFIGSHCMLIIAVTKQANTILSTTAAITPKTLALLAYFSGRFFVARAIIPMLSPLSARSSKVICSIPTISVIILFTCHLSPVFNTYYDNIIQQSIRFGKIFHLKMIE